MVCPKCGKEMIDGCIPAYKTALIFKPNDGGKHLSTIFSAGKGNVQLTKVPFWKYQKLESFYCPACQIIVAPVNSLD